MRMRSGHRSELAVTINKGLGRAIAGGDDPSHDNRVGAEIGFRRDDAFENRFAVLDRRNVGCARSHRYTGERMLRTTGKMHCEGLLAFCENMDGEHAAVAN